MEGNKIKIESLKLKISKHHEQLEKKLQATEIEKLMEDFIKKLTKKENFIDSGNYSNVYKDFFETNICFKKIKPSQRFNTNIDKEFDFMEEIYEANSVVETPEPIVKIKLITIDKENKKELHQIIGMKYFDLSIKLSDFLEAKQKLPKNFQSDIFFENLKDFIEKMHTIKNIYHRDISTKNILINLKTGKPILLDFGNSTYPPLEKNIDPYGRKIYLGVNLKDKDLENLENIKNSINLLIDNNKKKLYI